MNIILIALGSKEYGQMAHNLAVSLKKHIKCHITLLYEDVAVKGLNTHVFDALVKPIDEDYKDGQVINPFKLKTRLYNYIKGDTLYLDVDMFANNSVMEFVDKLDGYDLYIPTVEKLYWAETDTPHTPVNTSIIWVKKTKDNAKLFAKVAKLYDNPIPHKKIGSFYPDEIPFSIALADIALPQIKSLYSPDSKYKFAEMLKHPFLCMAGQPIQGAISDYDRMAKSQGLQYGLPWYKFNRKAKVFK